MIKKNRLHLSKLPVVIILVLCIMAAVPVKAQYNGIFYTASNEDFINPERGFYAHMEVQSQGSPLTTNQLRNLRNDKHSLILRLYYLKSFKNSPLSTSQLNLIKQDMNTLRLAGMKCILRFAYSQNIGQTDAPLEIVLNHLEQMKEIISENYDVIAVFQAGFIGAWGEWHSSTNDLETIPARRSILTKILEILPVDRMVQVRTPSFKRQIFERTKAITTDEAFNHSYYSRTGHHNDCFLASWDDYGTYQDTSEEKSYLNKECLYVPNGGETCDPGSYAQCVNSIKEMERLHYTYLNDGWHPDVISNWQKQGCLDEIKKRLGYRFELISGKYSEKVGRGRSLEFSLKLMNTGFAPLFNPRKIEVIMKEKNTGITYKVELPDDPRFWKPDSMIEQKFNIGVSPSVEPGKYMLYFNLPDSMEKLYGRPEYSIRFANEGLWETASGYNNLLAEVEIDDSENGADFNNELVFDLFNGSTAVREIMSESRSKELSINNYPNPFNNSTVFRFNIIEAGMTTLNIFNTIGERVGSPINKYLNEGLQETDYDASRLSSGIYYYVLNNAGNAVSGKLILIK